MPRFTPDDGQAASTVFRTVEGFIANAIDSTADEEALRQAYEATRQRHAPAVQTGTALLHQIETQCRFLPSGCETVDSILGGGVREGQVLELFGESGAGKTQLCMMAAARAAARGERVVYVDTSNAFTATRLLRLLRSIRNPVVTVEQAMSCVEVASKYTAHAVLAALDALLQQGRDAPNSNAAQPPNGQAEPPRRLSLVILDSLGAVITPILGGGSHSQGHALLASAAMMLKQVALQLRVAVMVTNHTVGGGGDRKKGGGADGPRQSSFVTYEKRPALGESWHCQAHCRLQLSLPAAEGGAYTVAVRSSTMVPPGRTAQYWLVPEGVVSSVPPRAAGGDNRNAPQ